MLEKLKSRKLWITFAIAVSILAVEVFGLPIDIEAIFAIAGLGASYNVAQGWVDAKEAGGGLLIVNPDGGDDEEDVLH